MKYDDLVIPKHWERRIATVTLMFASGAREIHEGVTRVKDDNRFVQLFFKAGPSLLIRTDLIERIEIGSPTDAI